MRITRTAKTVTKTAKRKLTDIGGTIGAVLVVLGVIFFGGTSCSPAPVKVACHVTYPADPNGPAACINGFPVFAPPAWVLGNSPVPVSSK